MPYCDTVSLQCSGPEGKVLINHEDKCKMRDFMLKRRSVLFQSVHVTKDRLWKCSGLKGVKETKPNTIPDPILDPALEKEILGSKDKQKKKKEIWLCYCTVVLLYCGYIRKYLYY